jgi:AraC family transcriptional regulator of adaptative response/methylated-DNA-[protein]-cysteine methyltransferase
MEETMNTEQCWQTVLNRDPERTATFIYAVRSTGIYCRPSCPSRRPAREHVAFFLHPEAAEEAGFRACRRCNPKGTPEPEPHAELVQRACRYIEAHLDEPLTLETLGAEVGMSPFHLQRTFKRIVGVSPRQYADSCRLNAFKGQVREGESVTGAIYEAGYSASSRLYERAPEQLGMTPATYARGGEGVEIRYTIADCPLGRLLVAATEKGICAISLGDSETDLEAALAKEYPAATLHRDGDNLKQWVSLLLDHIEGREPHLTLPLDLRATAFQRQVWETLRAIPYGTTLSYGEVARAIGRPTAARAVAQACASNRVALAIPCHRVVQEGGGTGGYRWGAERKRRLLAQEQRGAVEPMQMGLGLD